MKSAILLGIISLGSLAACQEQEKSTTTVVSEEKELPGKERASKAAENVRPELERDLAAKGLHLGDPVFIRAFKRERELEVHVRNRVTDQFDLFRTYKIAGMSGQRGPKLVEGDGQVPEGFYYVPPAAMKPDSQYHLAFNIGYPNDFDRSLGRTGSAIMVHGNRISIGCLAMTDEKIEEIYTLCDAAHQAGQPFFRVHLFPARMSTAWMLTMAGDPNKEFWENLKEGYDFFEMNRVPPEVSVADGHYQFK
jgi:murein L,D-transpeptidase YafK